MVYSVLLSDVAEKQFSKLPNEIRMRVGAVIDRIKVRPKSHLKKIVGSSYYRARAGDYRIVCDIQNERLLILVIEIGHRKNNYK